MRRSTEQEICAVLWMILAMQFDSWLWVVPGALGIYGIVCTCITAWREGMDDEADDASRS